MGITIKFGAASAVGISAVIGFSVLAAASATDGTGNEGYRVALQAILPALDPD